VSAEPCGSVAYWSGLIVDGAVFFYAMIDDGRASSTLLTWIVRWLPLSP